MKVVIYTTPTCGYCSQAKAFLAQQGIPFVEKNVAADRKAATEMVRISGQQGVPVITVDGEVVIGFNQPRLRQLLEAKRVPKLGAAVADAATQKGRRPGIPAAGAYVGRVRPGSPAARAGLRMGDVITALGGYPVDVASDLDRLLPEMPQGHEVSLTYVREGQTQYAQVRL